MKYFDLTKNIEGLKGEPHTKIEKVLVVDENMNPKYDNEGNPLVAEVKGLTMTYEDVIYASLANREKDDDGDTLIKKYKILKKISSNPKKVELDVDERKLIIDTINKNVVDVIVAGRINDLMNA